MDNIRHYKIQSIKRALFKDKPSIQKLFTDEDADDGYDSTVTTYVEEYDKYDYPNKRLEVLYKRKKKRQIKSKRGEMCMKECKRNCYIMFTERDQKELIKEFKKLNNEERVLYFGMNIDRSERRDYRRRRLPKHYNNFYLPAIPDKIRVCRKFFNMTLNLKCIYNL